MTPVRNVALLILAISTVNAQQSQWIAGGAMSLGRYQHQQTLLADGRVLVSGTYISSTARCASCAFTELYSPATGTWSAGPAMALPREGHAAVRLANGKVLVAGGYLSPGLNNETAELFDPATGVLTVTGQPRVARENAQAVLLLGGKVLLLGGVKITGNRADTTNETELYDPATGRWTATGAMNQGRMFGTTTLLEDGRVLVAGGDQGTQGKFTPQATAEIYDPTTGLWTSTGSLAAPRDSHTATLLPDGKVLVAAGWDSNGKIVNTAELLDPSTNRWTATGNLIAPRGDHSAVLLPNGLVLVAGGGAADDKARATTELYDPATGQWTAGPSLVQPRLLFHMTVLPSGRVLVTGGQTQYDGPGLSSVELLRTPAAGGIGVTVSGASFADNGSVAPDSLASLFGANLATEALAAAAAPLPQTLASSSVRVRDAAGAERIAGLWAVSPGQINFNMPAGTVTGMATVTVLNGTTTVAAGDVMVTPVAPGLFAAEGFGSGPAAANAIRVRAGTQSAEPVARFDGTRFVTVPIDLGPESDQVVLVLFGTGIKGHNGKPTAGIGTAPVPVLFAGPSSEFPGVDQINLLIPRTLIGSGEVDVELRANGRASNAVRVNIR